MAKPKEFIKKTRQVNNPDYEEGEFVYRFSVLYVISCIVCLFVFISNENYLLLLPMIIGITCLLYALVCSGFETMTQEYWIEKKRGK